MFRHCKLGHAALAHIIMAVELCPVDEGQSHIEMAVDEVADRVVLAQACQAVYYIRQWRTLR